MTSGTSSSNETCSQSKSLLIRPGDMVKFNRGLYCHWGVCVAPNQMVHVAPRNGRDELNSLNSFSATGSEAIVKLELIDRWAFQSDYCTDNYLDYKHRPKQVNEICAFALDQVDCSFWTYDPVTSNCEKFAIWCRYRINRWGRQGELVRNVTVGAVALLGACSLAAVGAAAVAYGAMEAIGGTGHRKNSKRKALKDKDQEQRQPEEENERKVVKLELESCDVEIVKQPVEMQDDDVSSLYSFDSVPVEELNEDSFELLKLEDDDDDQLDKEVDPDGEKGAVEIIDIHSDSEEFITAASENQDSLVAPPVQ